MSVEDVNTASHRSEHNNSHYIDAIVHSYLPRLISNSIQGMGKDTNVNEGVDSNVWCE